MATSLAAPCGLETSLMQAVGTRDDLEAFADLSRLFHRVRFAASRGLTEHVLGGRGRTGGGADSARSRRAVRCRDALPRAEMSSKTYMTGSGAKCQLAFSRLGGL